MHIHSRLYWEYMCAGLFLHHQARVRHNGHTDDRSSHGTMHWR